MDCVISALPQSPAGQAAPHPGCTVQCNFSLEIKLMEHNSVGTADDGIQWSMELSAVCDSECCTFTLPMEFHSASAFLQCLPTSPSSLPSGSVLGGSLRTAELHAEPCAIEIPAALHSMPGQLPPKCGKYSKDKALARQTLCIPGPELSCKRDGGAQPGWGDGAQHRTKKS